MELRTSRVREVILALYSDLVTSTCSAASSSGHTTQEERHQTDGAGAREAMEVIRGLENLLYSNRLQGRLLYQFPVPEGGL